MTVGINSYKGLGVPRYGESEMRQETSADMLTMTQSTLDGGDFLVLRSNVPEGSTVTGLDVYSISSAGAEAGGVQPVITLTTAVDFQITSTMSGSLLHMPGGNATSMGVLLPKNPRPGFWFDLYLSSQVDEGDVTLKSTGDSSARISIVGLTSLVSTVKNITPLSTIPGGIRVVAVSSILWWARHEFAYAPAGSTNTVDNDLTLGLWGVGATAA